MIGASQFMLDARQQYLAVNQAAMYWQLSRMESNSPFIDTKLNSLTLKDYQSQDGLRSKNYIYGWIQGRGLEAMVFHAGYFRQFDSELSQQLDAKSIALYKRLKLLYQSGSGSASFCYNRYLEPVCSSDKSGKLLQRRESGIATFSDFFVVKGLVSAACRHAPEDLAEHLHSLQAIILAIEENRFLITEAFHITEQALDGQADDYSPRMIALSAAALLHELNLAEFDDFSLRYIEYILDRHSEPNSGLLRTDLAGDICNIGHCIEFAGFALQLHQVQTGNRLDADIVEALSRLVILAFKQGFNGIGLNLSISLSSLKAVNGVCPWWSLPETIRATAVAAEVTQPGTRTHHPQIYQDLLKTWEKAHQAFFQHYWRKQPPVAYQTLTLDGPLDYIPATPDLDPGYHTGLSFLTAIEMVDRQFIDSELEC